MSTYGPHGGLLKQEKRGSWCGQFHGWDFNDYFGDVLLYIEQGSSHQGVCVVKYMDVIILSFMLSTSPLLWSFRHFVINPTHTM